MGISKEKKELEEKTREARIKTLGGMRAMIKIMAEKTASPPYNPHHEIDLVVELVQNLFRIYQPENAEALRLNNQQKLLLGNALKEGLQKGEQSTFQYLDATVETIAKQLGVEIPYSEIGM
jgi:hypothetical protein